MKTITKEHKGKSYQITVEDTAGSITMAAPYFDNLYCTKIRDGQGRFIFEASISKNAAAGLQKWIGLSAEEFLIEIAREHIATL